MDVVLRKVLIKVKEGTTVLLDLKGTRGRRCAPTSAESSTMTETVSWCEVYTEVSSEGLLLNFIL